MIYAAGVLIALQRCLFESHNMICDTLEHILIELLALLENISLLLLGVLYGDRDGCATEKGNRAICRNKILYFLRHYGVKITLFCVRCSTFFL